MKNIINYRKIYLWLYISAMMMLPGTGLAAVESKNALTEIKLAFDNVATNSADTTPTDVVDRVVLVILFIAGVSAFIYLIISGLQYITAGGDDEKAANGRKGVVNAIIGIIIVLASWFIYTAAIRAGEGVGTNSVESTL